MNDPDILEAKEKDMSVAEGRGLGREKSSSFARAGERLTW